MWQILVVLLFVAFAGPAIAVDGVIEINQAAALAGSVTGGPVFNDQPGFPVSLLSPGSYRLTGNLYVPDTNTTAIEVIVDDITIDLNGFVITTVDLCRPDCAPSGTGVGTGCP